MKAELIDVKSPDERVTSYLDDTIHKDLLGREIKYLEESNDLPTSTCMPGFCGCSQHADIASQLVRAFHICLTEGQVKTGSLLILSGTESSVTRTFFLGVTLKKPLLQTVVLACIEDDRVSFKGARQEHLHPHQLASIPIVTTTAHLFLDLLQHTAGPGDGFEFEVEHWFYKPFVDEAGRLHVNPEYVIQQFTFNPDKKSSVQRKAPVSLPFGLKPDRKRRRVEGGKPKSSTTKTSEAKPNVSKIARKPHRHDGYTHEDSDMTDSDESEPGFGSQLFAVNDSSNADHAVEEEEQIEPINEVMQQEILNAKEVAEEIAQADQVQEAFTAEVEASGATLGKTFFSKTLGLGAGSFAPTGRAKCYSCKEAITKGSIRFEWQWNKLRPHGFLHPYCIPQVSKSSNLEKETLEQLVKITSASSCSSSGIDPIRAEAARISNQMKGN